MADNMQAWETEVARLVTRLVVAVYMVPGQTKLYSETLKRVDALKLMLVIDFFFFFKLLCLPLLLPPVKVAGRNRKQRVLEK